MLERIDDYVRHEIEPPPALREAYDRMAATMQKRRVPSDAERLAQVVRRFEARVAWWNREFPKEAPMPLAIAKSVAPRDALGALRDARRERVSGADDSRGDRARQQPMPATAAAPPAQLAGRMAARSMGGGEEGRQRRRAEPDEHLDRPAAGGEQRRLAQAAPKQPIRRRGAPSTWTSAAATP